MQNLETAQLDTVFGGKTDAVKLQIESLSASIKDISTTKNAGGLDQNFMLMFMMFAMRPQQQPTVIAGPPPDMGGPPVGPVINVNTRVGRRRG